jgi:hypothetical protein
LKQICAIVFEGKIGDSTICKHEQELISGVRQGHH